MEDFISLIDENVLRELNALQTALYAKSYLFIADAQSLCALLMLLYFSVKSYSIMTGDSKLEILPLLRPFAITLIVLAWTPFLGFINTPMLFLEEKAKDSFSSERVEVNQLFIDRQERLGQIINRIEIVTVPLADAERADTGWDAMDNMLDELQTTLARARLIITHKLALYWRMFLENVMIIIFKTLTYVVLYAKILFLSMLAIIGPLSFAASIIPAFRDSWISWIQRYISVSLYGTFAYVAMIIGITHIKLALEKEIAFYDSILAGGEPELLAYLMRSGYAETSFLVAILVGGVGMLCAPIVSHWVLGAGSTGSLFKGAGAKAKSGMGSAASAVGAAGGAIGGVVTGAAGMAKKAMSR